MHKLKLWSQSCFAEETVRSMSILDPQNIADLVTPDASWLRNIDCGTLC